eukprot:scaffold2013_cov50-Cyclotella_meneghiniana.AAC.2
MAQQPRRWDNIAEERLSSLLHSADGITPPQIIPADDNLTGPWLDYWNITYFPEYCEQGNDSRRKHQDRKRLRNKLRAFLTHQTQQGQDPDEAEEDPFFEEGQEDAEMAPTPPAGRQPAPPRMRHPPPLLY